MPDSREDTDRINRTRAMPSFKEEAGQTAPPRSAERVDKPAMKGPPAPPRIAQTDAPPRLPRRHPPRRSASVAPPWWSVLLTTALVLGLVGCMAAGLFALGGRTAPEREPRLVILTAAPTNPNAAGITILATATLPPEFESAAMRPPATFVMAGPTLEPVYISPTPETIGLGKEVIVIDVGDQQLNVRDQPGYLTTTVIFRAPENSVFIISEGPIQADGLSWWRIQDPVNSSRSGWAASNYLQVVPPQDSE
jgi:hypothetical protein